MAPSVQSRIKDVIDRVVGSLEAKFARAEASEEPYITLEANDISTRYSSATALSCLYKQGDLISFESEVDPFTSRLKIPSNILASPFFRFLVVFPILNRILAPIVMLVHPIGSVRRSIIDYTYGRILVELKTIDQANKPMSNAQSSSNKLPGRGSFKRSMMDYFNDCFLEGKLTKSEFLDNSIFLFSAATGTSSDAVAKLLYNLAFHQDEQNKLRSSIQTDGIESEYLSWVVNESLRLFPPVPALSSRILSYDITTSDGVLIPSGTYVYTPGNTIHRWPEYWGPDADEFKPERWRHSNTFHPLQFLPFGAGRRKCPGADFALIAIKMLIVELLSRYQFECSPGTNAESIMQFDTYIVMTCTDVPVNLKISRVKATAA